MCYFRWEQIFLEPEIFFWNQHKQYANIARNFQMYICKLLFSYLRAERKEKF